jgi:catechol 2,3-dioxygenase-like lactoylglutathione lyase family enzyme
MKNHLQGIDTVIVGVKDITDSKQWYTEKLGLTAQWEDRILKLVVMDTGGPTSLTLWQTNSSRDGSSHPIFRTSNAADTRPAALGVVADPIIIDHLVTYFRFYDPDANVLEACQVYGE